MSNFIKTDDYDASIHREILDSITREDKESIEICENRAIAEMRTYLSARYDCTKIFSATGRNRHDLIMMFCIDIAIYHLFCIHNPQKLSKMRKDRYDRAVEWLKAVRKGDLNVEGLPVNETKLEASCPYQMRSNKKRSNHR